MHDSIGKRNADTFQKKNGSEYSNYDNAIRSQGGPKMTKIAQNIAKTLVFIAVSGWAYNLSISAQCNVPVGFVCITQATANDTLAKLDELKQSRDVIAKFMVERATNAAELAAANKVIDGWKALDATNTSIIQKYDAVMAMYEHVIKLQADLIDKLTNKINAPKSAWQKFVRAVETIAAIAVGIAIGRAGL